MTQASTIQHIAVLGSGVMGSGIAALAANAGIRVTLLDIVPKGETNRNALAENAVARMLKASPSPFLSPERTKFVTTGNLEDHLNLLSDADWIIEAVIEKKDIKQNVYSKVDGVRKEGAIISSNTSTLPLHELLDGLAPHIAKDFAITHFFNPPRQMRLLEVVKSPTMEEATFERLCAFADIALGKEVVECKDTPGFIANRIGVYWMTAGLNEALSSGIAIEDADAVMGRAAGFPKTGIFGLYDLIGLDLMLLIAKELLAALPANDAFRQLDAEPEILKKLIADGYTGRKGKGGFTRMQKDGDKKIKQVLDLKSGDYRAESKSTQPSAKARNVKELLAADDAGAKYAKRVLAKTLAYAASLIPEIADDIASVDTAMKNGFSWKYGPFELIDQIGVDDFIALLASENIPVPPLVQKAKGKKLYRSEHGKEEYFSTNGQYAERKSAAGILLLSDIKRKRAPILQNASARLWDMGDDVTCFELTTKMNAFDMEAFALLEEAIFKVNTDFRGLIIGHDGEPFSAGANLSVFLNHAQNGEWDAIERMIARGQEVFMRLKRAPFPSIAALSGLALGGGCELALHASTIQAHAEAYPGLVEVNVGLIPAWGGCAEMLVRHGEALTPFEMILSAKTATSSDDARAMKALKTSDRVTMNRARLLADAKARLLEIAPGYQSTKPETITLAPNTAAMLEQALAAKSELPAHTQTIGKVLARVLSANGKTQASEEDILALEREGFMELIKTPESQARIEHMLNTGKPLRN